MRSIGFDDSFFLRLYSYVSFSVGRFSFLLLLLLLLMPHSPFHLRILLAHLFFFYMTDDVTPLLLCLPSSFFTIPVGLVSSSSSHPGVFFSSS